MLPKKIRIKHLLLFISVITFCTTVKSQEADDIWAIGLNITPKTAYHTIIFDDGKELTSEDKSFYRDIINKGNYNLLGYAIGVPILYQKSRFGFETGLYYNQQKFGKLRLVKTSDSLEFNGSSVITSIDSKSTYCFIDVPINFGYEFLNKKSISFYSKLGLSIRYLVRANNYGMIKRSDGKYESNSYNMFDQSIIRRLNLFPTIYLGSSYRLNSNITIHMEPTFSFALTSISDGGDVAYKQTEIGLRIGILYRIH